MKKIAILMMVLISCFTQCKKESVLDESSQIRQNAWNSLNAQEQATVTVDWHTAPISDEVAYNSKRACSVTFNTSEDALLGPIVVYVEKSTKSVIAKVPRM